MKPKKSIRSAFVLLASSVALIQVSYSQTVEIDPGAIPSGFTLAPTGTWNWDSDGDLEGWTANVGLTLDSGTPIGGVVSGTAATGDPNLASSNAPLVAIPTPYRTIVEFSLQKEASDPSAVQVFWADNKYAGFSAGKSVTISGATFAADGNFKTVRVTFPAGVINTNLSRLRIDPINDAPNIGKTMSLDYVRVYTEDVTPLNWDADTVTPGAQGGSGTWDQVTTANWWDGAANTAWPASGTAAIFAGTAGTVTVAGGGVDANYAEFQTTGYTVTGGPINVGSDAANYKITSATTRIDSELTGSAPLKLQGGGTNPTIVLGGTNTSLTGGVTQAIQYLGITNDDALGTGTFTAGAGGNTFISSLDGDRTISNNVVFAGNRMLIQNSDLGTGLGFGDLTIDGNLALNCVSPADLYLRKNLTVNGVVSGGNSGIGLLLAGNAGTITLNNTANTFTNNLTYSVGSTVEIAGDGSLGDAANGVNFNGGSGTLRALDSFSSARPININGNTTGKIDTNGFDLTLSGTITGTTTGANNSTFQKVGLGKLTLDGTGSNLYGGFRVDEGTLEVTGGSILSQKWNGSYGVGGGAVCNILAGGTVNTQQYFAVGNGVAPTTEASFNVNGGVFTSGLELLVGQNGNGRFTMTSGTATLNLLSFGDGPDASRTAICDLNGGTINLARTHRRGGSATATINFNGSTLVAKSDQTDFLRGTIADTTYNVKTGGAKIDTNGFNIAILQPLVADSTNGGLTKSGAGTLTLNATNTYTGPTTVTEGVLEVNGTSIDITGKVDIAGGKVLIPASTNEVVDTLFYNGVQQPAGVYGSSSAAGPGVTTNDTYFDVAGSGTLTVNNGPGNTYATWIGSKPPATGFTPDSDNDGVANGVENVLGTDPNAYSPGLTEVSATATSVTYKHTLNPTIASDVSYSYEWSSDLTEWKASGIANTAGTIGTITPSAPAAGVVTVVTTQSGTPSGKLFTRLNAVKP